MNDSTKDLLKSYLPDYVEMITEKSKGGLFVCPLCGSGKGRNKTGAFSIYESGTKWNCFSCGKGGDVFDLIGEHEGITEKPEQFKKAAQLFNIDIDDNGGSNQKQYEKRKKERPAEEVLKYDYTDYFLKCNENLKNTDYLTKRGISQATADRFLIGYDESWNDHGRKKSKYKCLIMPTSKYSYNTRKTHMEPWDDIKNLKPKGVPYHLFNGEVLDEDKPVIIVEGEIDALSVMEVGGVAVGLGGGGNYREVVRKAKEGKRKKSIIISLDNDEKGREYQEKFKNECEENGVNYIVFNIAGDCKDANEILLKDKEKFSELVAAAMFYGEKGVTPEEEAEYLKNSTSNYIDDFFCEIAKSKANTPYIPTGFQNLDKILEGGLYEGLYFLGAVSSLGKSTFLLQVADQIAQQGEDVLIFALEMARSELMAKSLSRLTCDIAITKNWPLSCAKSNRGITTGKRYDNYNEKEIKLINAAINAYRDYSKHIFISEGVGDISVQDIVKTVKKHIRITGRKPVVIIDYLQILAPYNVKYTDKQNTDKAVLELKRLSRDNKITVIGISSFNRDNYKEAVTMKAFKESGAIEYGSDVLIGLQFEGAGTAGFDLEECKKDKVRKVELKILKNRNGRTGDTIKYNYYPIFNKYEEKEILERKR